MENETYFLPDGARQYITSTVSLRDNDSIVIHVLNLSNDPKTARVLIYKNAGNGAPQVYDSSVITVKPKWQWGLGYNIEERNSGEFWVQLELSSEMLIPKVSFESYTGDRWTPFVSYKPGDFAVFDDKHRRIR
jgi:hypothetical protein